VSTHYHDRKLIQPVNRSIGEMVQNLQVRLENTGAEVAMCEEDCEVVRQMKQLLENTLQDLLIELKASCQRVKRISVNYNVVTDLHNGISHIKSDSSILTSSNVRQRADQVIDELTQLCKEINDQTPPQQLKEGRTSNPIEGKRQHRSKQKREQHDDLYIEQWPTSDLVNCHFYGSWMIRGYTYYLDTRLIRKELQRRLNGDSVGYLSQQELLVFGKQFEIYHRKSKEELRETANQIETEIKSCTNNDVSKILEIPCEKLLGLASINILLRNNY
jgi:hypothetical protein